MLLLGVCIVNTRVYTLLQELMNPISMHFNNDSNNHDIDEPRTNAVILQIDMLVPGILGKREDYGRRYCGGKPLFIARGVYDWRSSSNLAELNAVLQKHLLIRRLKKNVLQDLPAKQRQRIPIEIDPDCVGVRVLVPFHLAFC